MGAVFDISFNQDTVVQGIKINKGYDQVRHDLGFGLITLDATGKITGGYGECVTEETLTKMTGVLDCTDRQYFFYKGQLLFPQAIVSSEFSRLFDTFYRDFGPCVHDGKIITMSEDGAEYFLSALNHYRKALSTDYKVKGTFELYFQKDNPYFNTGFFGRAPIEEYLEDLDKLREYYQTGTENWRIGTVVKEHTVEEMFELLRQKWGDADVNTTKVKAIGGGFWELMRSEGIPEFSFDGEIKLY
ncbi:hypothetical protein 2050HW_00163 [Serratia phage vB_SmaM_ 2050HW]|uniref:Uncharacterized protein n=1 Tax=Serratia phage vB_SmaM_ 2050HW TaxID=2024252 RepID=A0A289ZTW1_9CAUD|nr:hypothetical protein HWB23_gp163 [Serratia phage vB_SmaM_ 2050HW]ATA65498.1 hypothetical protein 2050HW_00163 [Serratia phage vB_SmaM_ 2050HW]UCR74761.1 hypothetical protein [Serratia phage BUCT660]